MRAGMIKRGTEGRGGLASVRRPQKKRHQMTRTKMRAASTKGAYCFQASIRFSFLAPHLNCLDSDTSLEEILLTSAERAGGGCGVMRKSEARGTCEG